MIIVYMKKGDKHTFTLSTHEQEVKAAAAWRVFAGDPDYKNKVFVFTDKTTKERHAFKVMDIRDCVLCEAAVADMCTTTST